MSTEKFMSPTRFATWCLLSLSTVAMYQFWSIQENPTTAANIFYILCSAAFTYIFNTLDHIIDKTHTCTEACRLVGEGVMLFNLMVLSGCVAEFFYEEFEATTESISRNTQVLVIQFALSLMCIYLSEYWRLYWRSKLPPKSSCQIDLEAQAET